MANSKPRLFIGSSTESKPYAVAVMRELQRYAEINPWFANVFKVNNATMDDLETQIDHNDFAVFVFGPDDVVDFRGKRVLAPRDNTIFELELFWGHLRRERVFYIVPMESRKLYQDAEITEFHIPSDLHGLTFITYDTRQKNMDAAVVTACDTIRQKIDELGQFVNPAHQSLISFLTQFSKDLLSDPGRKFDYLYEAIRTAYDTKAFANAKVSGAAVWAVEGADGIRQVAGNVGRGRFYSFTDYKSGSTTKPLVVDVYLTGTEQAMLYKKTGVASVFLLCYPVAKELVVTIHLTINGAMAATRIESLMNENVELMSSINYIFGGDVT
ncbi:TIR domain-containing protein [Paenibacillus tengchongensis]|uniref:TIR domain-containing protein n=1 Tax=Paenibacillus tengchongensis TaxID=2608684 RepID=UPI001652618E|nr:TIR domain-containing protein [Paenibacillus tengchongensis]